jgi:hypothetical protein
MRWAERGKLEGSPSPRSESAPIRPLTARPCSPLHERPDVPCADVGSLVDANASRCWLRATALDEQDANTDLVAVSVREPPGQSQAAAPLEKTTIRDDGSDRS